MLRVRFAPSPTGNLHLGSVRTALYNWLIAKKQGGTYILRIEDTDVERSTKEYEKNILDGLKWLGLDWDEGPGVGGDYSPYLQSERIKKGIYQPFIDKLLKENKAYLCFCNPNVAADFSPRVDKAQAKACDYKNSQSADGSYIDKSSYCKCHNLTQEEKETFTKEGQKPAVRYLVPNEKIIIDDLIRGKVEIDTKLIGDMIIQKADGSPAYNFAVVVDDITMNINLIIRGEDHLSNTPKQILLYRALGHEIPKFAHMSMILGPDKSKLSKRHGATSVIEYQEKGYLPHAVINYLTLLGWSHPQEKEIIPIEEIIQTFSLDRVGKSGAVFDIEKFTWMNGQYIRMLTKDELYEKVFPYIKEEKIKKDEKLKDMIFSIQNKLPVLSEASNLLEIYFEENPAYSEEFKNKNIKEGSIDILSRLLDYLKSEDNYSVENILSILEKTYDEFKVNKGRVLKPLRYALCGIRSGPNLEIIISIFGKEKTVNRLENFICNM